MFRTFKRPLVPPTNPTSLKKKKSGLAFKSSYSAPNCYFSNFFGGSEFTFMSKRTTNPRLCRLYIALRDREWDTPNGYKNFKKCREKLMGKKIYKESRDNSSALRIWCVLRLGVTKCNMSKPM